MPWPLFYQQAFSPHAVPDASTTAAQTDAAAPESTAAAVTEEAGSESTAAQEAESTAETAVESKGKVTVAGNQRSPRGNPWKQQNP